MDDEIFRLAFFGIFWVFWILSKVHKARKKNLENGGQAAPPSALSDRVFGNKAATPTKLISEIDGLLARLNDQTRDLRTEIRGLGRAGGALEDAIRDSIVGPLDSVAETWRAVKQNLEAGGVVENLRAHVQSTSQWASVLQGRIASIAQLTTERSSRELGQVLDDADAVAKAFIAPFGDFARAHGIDFPRQEPISVPANESTESVWVGLIPNHPVLMVPRNFGADIYRWMAVPHEIAHVIWHRTPGLKEEVRTKLGLHDSSNLLGTREQIQNLPRRLMASWLLEFFADWGAVMMAGPAAVHGLSYVFDQRANPQKAAVIWVTRDGQYDEHPPSHLRVLVACALLRRIGFIVQADHIEKEWRAHHPVQRFSVPVAGNQRVPFMSEDIVTYVSAYAVAFYEAQFDSLSGRSFQSIPGYEMSFGLWSRVSKDASKLRSGTGFHDDARLVICGAVEARWHEPGHAEEIRIATRDAIVGAHAPLSDRRVTRRRGTQRITGRFGKADFRDALVLQDIAGRRRL